MLKDTNTRNLLCVLAGPVAALKVRHVWVRDGQEIEMKPPSFLVIDAGAEPPVTPGGVGVMLYRFDAAGECVGDTWHQNIDDAKDQAGFEYESLLQEWEEIPPGIDMIAHGRARMSSMEGKAH